MEVKIISKEIIKPSSPTPQSSRTFNFCLYDQLAPQLYIPILKFFSPPPPPHHDNLPNKKSSVRLKTSFSKALTNYYPLAGRIRNDSSSVDCNDEGAVFIEARVAGDMSSVALTQQNTLNLQPLLPCHPRERSPELSTQVLLAVQINNFDCGGIGIGLCVWHEIADGVIAACFVKNWAEICCGGPNEKNDSTNTIASGNVMELSSLFPQQDASVFPMIHLFRQFPTCEDGLQKLSFHGSKIASLRRNIEKATRFEAVASLIFGAFAAATRCSEIGAYWVVNLRKRMDPPLPEDCFGNIYHTATATVLNCNYNNMARVIRESTKNINDESVRRLHEGNKYFEMLREWSEEAAEKKMRLFGLSSWCRFPFYDVDFGWGKPVWVCPVFCYSSNVCFIIDARDGAGIEAWVGLHKDDMEKFLQNPDILEYASFKCKLPNCLD